jgi:SAM-dependent methyltransferase
MEATLAPVDEPLIRALRLDAPCSIADVGCGGGGTTLEIFRRAPAGSVVHGFDISPVLIETARARPQPEESAIAFAVTDVATAAAPETPYDRLLSRFGTMFFDDPPAAFANLLHWLTPGGRFAFAVWGPLRDNPWMTDVGEVVSAFIDVPRPDPDGPGPFRYADADRLRQLLADAGFNDLAVDEWRGRLPVGGGVSAVEAADFALASFSSFGDQLAAAGDPVLQAARQALTERLSRYQRDEAVWVDARVHLFTGARPE